MSTMPTGDDWLKRLMYGQDPRDPFRGVKKSSNPLDVFRQSIGPGSAIEERRQPGGGVPLSPEEEEQFMEDTGQAEQPIVVNGGRINPADYDTGGLPPSTSNLNWLIQRQADEEARKAAYKPGPNGEKPLLKERKGAWGTTGTLRKILGRVSDAMLMAHGMKPVYGPQRQREKAADALAGFTQNPRAAAERYLEVDPEGAVELFDKSEDNSVKREQLESLDANRKDGINNRRRDDVIRFRNQMARYVQTAQGNPAKMAFVLAQAQKLAQELGVPVETLLPSDMTDEEAAIFATGDMTVNQQENWPRRDRALDQGDRRLGQGDRGLDIRQQQVDKPSAGPAAKLPTEASEIAAIRRKVDNGEELRPGEAATWTRYVSGGGKGGKSRIPASSSGETGRGSTSAGTPPKGKKSPFRIVN